MGFGTPVVVSYHPPLIDFLLSASRITSPCPSCSLSTGIHALHLGGTPLPSLWIVRNLFHSSYPILPFFLVRVAPLTKVQRSITVINNAPMEYLGDLNRGLAYIRRFRTAWPQDVHRREMLDVLRTFGPVVVSRSCSSYQPLSEFSLPFYRTIT